MTLKEFYDQVEENIISEIEDKLAIKRDANGEQYIYSNYPPVTKSSILNRLECEIESPWEDIEEPFTENEDKELYENVKNNVLKTFDVFYQKRKEFVLKYHPENLELLDPYDE